MPSPRGFIAAVIICAAPAFAQQPSAGTTARGVEADVKLALRDALRLGDTERSKAADRLQKLLASLEADRVLPVDRRAQLIRVVTDQLRILKADPVPRIDPKDIPLPPAAAKRAEEFTAVRAGIAEAVALTRDGKNAEADQKVADLTRRFPDNFAVEFLVASQQTATRRDEAAATSRAKERNTSDSLAGIDRAAGGPIPKNDIAFAKDFKEKSAKRQADTAPTAEELKMLKALNTEITPQFNGSRIEDAVDYLSTITGLPIMLDKGALDELGVTYDTKVTLAVKRPVSASIALRAILRQIGLTFVARDGVIFATTSVRAREFLTTKVFNVTDVIFPIDPNDPVTRNPHVNALMLMNVIVSTIDPDSWEQRGGAGVIRYYPPLFAIVVRQSTEVHAQMRGGRAVKPGTGEP
jgi:hypothetical protein